MKKYGFGVDVGGTTCKIGFFENSGNMLDKWEIKTNTENHGASILDDIVASLESKLADAGISKDEVEGQGAKFTLEFKHLFGIIYGCF